MSSLFILNYQKDNLGSGGSHKDHDDDMRTHQATSSGRFEPTMLSTRSRCVRKYPVRAKNFKQLEDLTSDLLSKLSRAKLSPTRTENVLKVRQNILHADGLQNDPNKPQTGLTFEQLRPEPALNVLPNSSETLLTGSLFKLHMKQTQSQLKQWKGVNRNNDKFTNTGQKAFEFSESESVAKSNSLKQSKHHLNFPNKLKKDPSVYRYNSKQSVHNRKMNHFFGSKLNRLGNGGQAYGLEIAKLALRKQLKLRQKDNRNVLIRRQHHENITKGAQVADLLKFVVIPTAVPNDSQQQHPSVTNDFAGTEEQTLNLSRKKIGQDQRSKSVRIKNDRNVTGALEKQTPRCGRLGINQLGRVQPTVVSENIPQNNGSLREGPVRGRHGAKLFGGITKLNKNKLQKAIKSPLWVTGRGTKLARLSEARGNSNQTVLVLDLVEGRRELCSTHAYQLYRGRSACWLGTSGLHEMEQA